MSVPGTILLAGVVGSTAYGLATEDSDVDRLGMFAAPTVVFHGLRRPTETSTTTHPDATFHEAGKWLRLALGGNPTVMELAWLDQYETRTPLGEELIAIRSSLLSAKRVRDAYCGYATQQFRKLEARGDGSFSADTRKRTEKHARHLWRLLYQGSVLHQTGRLIVRLSPDRAATCRTFGERIAAGDLALAEVAFRDAEQIFDAPGVLPDRPDEEAAERWLLRVRAAFLPADTPADSGHIAPTRRGG